MAENTRFHLLWRTLRSQSAKVICAAGIATRTHPLINIAAHDSVELRLRIGPHFFHTIPPIRAGGASVSVADGLSPGRRTRCAPTPSVGWGTPDPVAEDPAKPIDPPQRWQFWWSGQAPGTRLRPTAALAERRAAPMGGDRVSVPDIGAHPYLLARRRISRVKPVKAGRDPIRPGLPLRVVGLPVAFGHAWQREDQLP